jgi:hypothetical protein
METLGQAFRTAIEQAAGSGQDRPRMRRNEETGEVEHYHEKDEGAWSAEERTAALGCAERIENAVMDGAEIDGEVIASLKEIATGRDTPAHAAILNGLREWTTALRVQLNN